MSDFVNPMLGGLSDSDDSDDDGSFGDLSPGANPLAGMSGSSDDESLSSGSDCGIDSSAGGASSKTGKKATASDLLAELMSGIDIPPPALVEPDPEPEPAPKPKPKKKRVKKDPIAMMKALRMQSKKKHRADHSGEQQKVHNGVLEHMVGHTKGGESSAVLEYLRRKREGGMEEAGSSPRSRRVQGGLPQPQSTMCSELLTARTRLHSATTGGTGTGVVHTPPRRAGGRSPGRPESPRVRQLKRLSQGEATKREEHALELAAHNDLHDAAEDELDSVRSQIEQVIRNSPRAARAAKRPSLFGGASDSEEDTGFSLFAPKDGGAQ